MTSDPTPNSLGLDFASCPAGADPAQPHEENTSSSQEDQTAHSISGSGEAKEKKTPYVNLERVKTGGMEREKLSDEALSERIARMKEQNEKIKQRRLDVQADEDAFRKTQETERAKLAQTRKVQEIVDRTREQNAKKKLDKIQSREWDSGKPANDWKLQHKSAESPRRYLGSGDPPADGAQASAKGNNDESRGLHVRNGAQRGRGRARGRGGSNQGRGGGFPVASASSHGIVSSLISSPPSNPENVDTGKGA